MIARKRTRRAPRKPAGIDIAAVLKELHAARKEKFKTHDIDTGNMLEINYTYDAKNEDYDPKGGTIYNSEFEERAGQLDGAEVDEFPGCCGISVLQNLEFSNNGDGKFPGTDAQGHALLYEAAVQGIGGLILASTVVTQKDAVAGLRAAGFEVLKTFTNPGTKREVTLWGKVGRS